MTAGVVPRLLRRRPAPWATFIALVILASGLYFCFTDKMALDLLNGAFSLAALVAILVGICWHRPAYPRPWYCFAVGTAALTIGNASWVYYDGPWQRAAPTPAPSDIAYFVGYAWAFLGLSLLARRRTGDRDQANRIDTGIITLGLGLVLWVVVMDRYFDNPVLPLAARLVAIAYPLIDLLLFAGVLRLLLVPGGRSGSFTLLATYLGLSLLTDIATSILTLEGLYTIATPLLLGWLVAAACLGASALHPTMRTVGEPLPLPPARLTWGRLLPLVLATLVGPALYLIQRFNGTDPDIEVILAASVLLSLLVAARLTGLARQAGTSEATFRQLFAANPHPMWVYRLSDRRILEVNAAAIAQYGYDREEFLSLHLEDLRPAADRARFLTEVMPHLRPHEPPRAHHHLLRNGHLLDVEVASHALEYQGAPARLVVAQDISARATLERQLSHQAFHDALTGLPNRALFLDRLAQARQRASREPRPLAVLFLDLDRFKDINDSLGHDAGDQLLVAVAARLRRAVRGADTVARLGGDEFTILMEPPTDLEEATQAAERILEAFQVPFLVGGQSLAVTTSIGVVVSPQGQDDPGDLLRFADIALYQAKAAGKSRYAVFDTRMSTAARERAALETELRQTLADGALTLHYQPKVDLATGGLVGLEALARWPHPERGDISPVIFIPLAEETGLIQGLGEWVLHTACRQMVEWHRVYPSSQRVRLSVNLSARQLYHGDVVAMVATVLAETGLSPSFLQLEITESVLMDDGEASAKTLQRLRALGVHLAIDDFGTGYSSLSYLKRFPVDTVKIDKSFVRDLGEDADDAAIVRAIIGLGQTLGLRVIAEGIETAEHLARLRDLGCEIGQGFYFSRPLDVAATTALLTADADTPDPEREATQAASTLARISV